MCEFFERHDANLYDVRIDNHRECLGLEGSTVLCLDAAMAGIGSNSCGPALRSRYRVDGHELGMELHLLLTTPDHIETHDEVKS